MHAQSATLPLVESPLLTPAPARLGTPHSLILRGVSWTTYEQLLKDFTDRHVAHFAYDRGVLEIMVLSSEHEEPNRTLSLLVEILAAELNMEVRNLGSTTFKREDLSRGFEPDTCFYIQHEARIRGKKKIDLAIDPPPDLVIEIDISNSSLDKFPIYEALGVPEVWHSDGATVTLFTLEGTEYRPHSTSMAFPEVTQGTLSRFLVESQSQPRAAWVRNIRGWAQQHIRTPHP